MFMFGLGAEIARIELAETKAQDDHRTKQLEAVKHRSSIKAIQEQLQNPRLKRPRQRALQGQIRKLAARETRCLNTATRVRAMS